MARNISISLCCSFVCLPLVCRRRSPGNTNELACRATRGARLATGRRFGGCIIRSSFLHSPAAYSAIFGVRVLPRTLQRFYKPPNPDLDEAAMKQCSLTGTCQKCTYQDPSRALHAPAATAATPPNLHVQTQTPRTDKAEDSASITLDHEAKEPRGDDQKPGEEAAETGSVRAG